MANKFESFVLITLLFFETKSTLDIESFYVVHIL